MKWSAEEDLKLELAVKIHKRMDGSPDWALIAEHIDGKTSQQCANRFYRMQNRPSKRGKWSEEEDAKLRQAVESNLRSNGRPNWDAVAEIIVGRTHKQCAAHYYRIKSTTCSSQTKKGKWSAEDH